MSRSARYSVILADDHPLLLHGLADLVALSPRFSVIGTTTSGRQALALMRRQDPHLAVLDISMPDLDGLAILRAAVHHSLSARVIFLTATITPAQISEALAFDAWGILLKESAPDTLIQCLSAVAAGRRWFSQELLDKADPNWTEKNDLPSLDLLTPREREIVALTCQGLSNDVIATRLGATRGTVKIHLHNIYQKLGVANRTALAALAFDMRVQS